MYLGIGQSFAMAAFLDGRYKNARDTLIQPDITVENLGAQIDYYGLPVACMRVTTADDTSTEIAASTYDLLEILKDPAFPQGVSPVRTTLSQAHAKAVRFGEAESQRREQEWDDGVAKVKSFLRRCLPF